MVRGRSRAQVALAGREFNRAYAPTAPEYQYVENRCPYTIGDLEKLDRQRDYKDAFIKYCLAEEFIEYFRHPDSSCGRDVVAKARSYYLSATGLDATLPPIDIRDVERRLDTLATYAREEEERNAAEIEGILAREAALQAWIEETHREPSADEAVTTEERDYWVGDDFFSRANRFLERALAESQSMRTSADQNWNEGSRLGEQLRAEENWNRYSHELERITGVYGHN